jgi:DMSO reductase anchor subunit
MHPNFSLVFFTTLAGMAQGLILFIAAFSINGNTFPNDFLAVLALPVAIALLTISLLASFFHLGHPERAWRAAHMWKTSWLSREVIVLPLFMGTSALAWYYAFIGQPIGAIWPVLILLAFLLWVCTAQIYQCIRFIQEWSHPLTMINFIALGLSSGWLLLGSLILFWPDPIAEPSLNIFSTVGVLFIFLALTIKLTVWKRNRDLRPKSTINSAIGVQNFSVRQTSMGLMGGSFNTREFFHHQSIAFLSNLRKIIFFGVYLIPILLLIYASQSSSYSLIPISLLIHYCGLIAERWMFFAEANHPQNLYYQRIS